MWRRSCWPAACSRSCACSTAARARWRRAGSTRRRRQPCARPRSRPRRAGAPGGRRCFGGDAHCPRLHRGQRVQACAPCPLQPHYTPPPLPRTPQHTHAYYHTLAPHLCSSTAAAAAGSSSGAAAGEAGSSSGGALDPDEPLYGTVTWVIAHSLDLVASRSFTHGESKKVILLRRLWTRGCGPVAVGAAGPWHPIGRAMTPLQESGNRGIPTAASADEQPPPASSADAACLPSPPPSPQLLLQSVILLLASLL